MFTSFLIEVAGSPVGVAILREEGDYHFHASDERVHALDGASFDHPGRAELAARRLLGSVRRGARRPPAERRGARMQ